MAKAPKKSQDPTEAALSAIEEALQLGKDEKPAESRESAEPIEITEEQEQSRLQRRLSAAAPTAGEPAERIEPEMPRAEPVREPAREPIRESAREPVPAPVRRPDRPMRRAAANDDRQSVGQIIARLHSRPSRTPLVLASILSVLWLVGGIAWAISLYRQEFSLGEFLTNPIVFPVAAGLLLPAAGFLLLAVLIRRMQELRGIARSMTEVTVRLAEPENLSTDTVVTVGQAIRREVAALGDGIERAIARATELEAMVKNEVSTLERAYDDNEVRVRNLVDELQSERELDSFPRRAAARIHRPLARGLYARRRADRRARQFRRHRSHRPRVGRHHRPLRGGARPDRHRRRHGHRRHDHQGERDHRAHDPGRHRGRQGAGLA